MNKTEVFASIAFDERLVNPARAKAREAYDIVIGSGTAEDRRRFGRDVLVSIAHEYMLGTKAEQAAMADVPGTETNPY